jgi:hypothetical protein
MSTESRWELLHDDPQFDMSKGDILICESMHSAWAADKVAVVRRESDGYEPGCSEYRQSVRHISGPHLGCRGKCEAGR